MEQVRLDPIRIGFPYELGLTFPAGYLEAGETVRASLRKTPNDSSALVSLTAVRDAELVTLSLTKEQTAALTPGQVLMDLVLDQGAVEYAASSPRFLIAVEHHTTRHS